MARKPIHFEIKSVGWGIFNLLPGPDYECIVTWSDGSQSRGYGDTKSEAKANALKKGR
jgi:hypothetical protein